MVRTRSMLQNSTPPSTPSPASSRVELSSQTPLPSQVALSLQTPPVSIVKSASRRAAKSTLESSKYRDVPGRPEGEYRNILAVLRTWAVQHNIDLNYTEEFQVPSAGSGDFSVHHIVLVCISQATDNKLAHQAEMFLQSTFQYTIVDENGDSKVVRGNTPNYHAIHKAPLKDLERAIMPAGLYEKRSRYIMGLLNRVFNENVRRLHLDNAQKQDNQQNAADFVPGLLSVDFLIEMTAEQRFKWLMEVPGIGLKTTACIVSFAFNDPIFAVDTHVLRLSKWLQWLPAGITLASHANEACFYLQDKIPVDIMYALHQALWNHGDKCDACRSRATEKTKGYKEALLACPLSPYMDRALRIMERNNESRKRKSTSSEEAADDAPPSKRVKTPKKAVDQKRWAVTATNGSIKGWKLWLGDYVQVKSNVVNDNFALSQRANVATEAPLILMRRAFVPPGLSIVEEPKAPTVLRGGNGKVRITTMEEKYRGSMLEKQELRLKLKDDLDVKF